MLKGISQLNRRPGKLCAARKSPSFVSGQEESADFKGKVSVVPDVCESAYDRIQIQRSEKRSEMRIRIPHIVLHVQGSDVITEYAECFVLWHFLHIRVSRVPYGVKKRVIHGFDHSEQVGSIIDPIKTVHTHFIEIFNQNVYAVLLRSLQQGHEKFPVTRKGEKQLYGLYYDYDSSFEHGMWGAIRESSLLKCNNPAHQYHCVPDIDNQNILKSVMPDCIMVMNKTLEFLNELYTLPKSLFEEVIGFEIKSINGENDTNTD